MLSVKSTYRLALLFAGAPALFGCAQTAPPSAYTPITGVQLPSAVLYQGLGCGVGPSQLFKYAALVGCQLGDAGLATPCPGSAPDAGTYVASLVSDCFSDALFSNLPTPSSGNPSFYFQVYGFNQASYRALDGGGLDCPPSSTSNAACPGQNPDVVLQAAPFANWTTSCTAAQVAGATVIADCSPLEPVDQGSPDAAAPEDAADVSDAGEPPGEDAAPE